MAKWQIAGVAASGLLLSFTPGCRLLDPVPGDEEIGATVRKAPPSPPTLGPTVLTDVASVEIQQRGRYNADERYWPVRVHVRGSAKIKVTNLSQLGHWRVSYAYDAAGPRWRLEGLVP